MNLWNQLNNPLYIWWKCKKYFKFPKIKFIIGKNIYFYGLYILNEYYDKIYHIRFSAVGSKFKNDMIYFSWNPFIQICLFRKYHFIIMFYYNKESYINDLTWETMLNYVYNKEFFINIFIKYKPIINRNLTKKGLFYEKTISMR